MEPPIAYVIPTARSEVVNRVRRKATQGWAMWQKQHKQDVHGVHEAQS